MYLSYKSKQFNFSIVGITSTAVCRDLSTTHIGFRSEETKQ